MMVMMLYLIFRFITRMTTGALGDNPEESIRIHIHAEMRKHRQETPKH